MAEGIAQRYGVSKSELLSPEAGDLAVRMALGETHIIAETKKALEEQGVDVGVLERLVPQTHCCAFVYGRLFRTLVSSGCSQGPAVFWWTRPCCSARQDHVDLSGMMDIILGQIVCLL